VIDFPSFVHLFSHLLSPLPRVLSLAFGRNAGKKLVREGEENERCP